MEYIGTRDVTRDDKGRVWFPYTNWPSTSLHVLPQRCAQGTYLLCVPQRLDLAITLPFVERPISSRCTVQLGRILDAAQISNPLVWLGASRHVELWSARTLEQHLSEARERNHSLLSRALWPYASKSF